MAESNFKCGTSSGAGQSVCFVFIQPLYPKLENVSIFKEHL